MITLLSASTAKARPVGISQSLYWSDEYLQDIEPLNAEWNNELRLKLALKAKQHGRRAQPRGFCLRGVRLSLYRAFLGLGQNQASLLTYDMRKLPIDAPRKKNRYFNPARSAESFRQWALNNPDSMCRFLGLESIQWNHHLDLRKGMILIYGKGKCGFHHRFGHIEVVTDGIVKEACSDHCRTLNSKCGPDMVLVPTQNCKQFHQKLGLQGSV